VPPVSVVELLERFAEENPAVSFLGASCRNSADRGCNPERPANDWKTALFPPYQLLIESYSKAQEVVRQHEQLDSVLA